MTAELLPLIDRCLRGDQTAMASLVERHAPLVFGLALRMLRHREDAEDVAQEVLVRMLRGLGTWDRSREFKPWLLAITGNRCRTALAARQRRQANAPLDHDPIDSRPDDFSPLHEEVELALGCLREEYRLAFLLFHHLELSYAEIAAVLGCPPGTVKTWVHRARKRLANELIRRGAVEEVSV